MKKLLALVVILGMASMANATVILSVNGQNAPDEITLKPSDVIDLDVHYTGDGKDWILYTDVSSLSQRLFSLGTPVKGPGIGDVGVIDMYEIADLDVMEISATMGHFSAAYNAGTIFTVPFHCEGQGDVFVQLWSDENGYEAPVDMLTIHQIPEPMTMSLLALGGLGLLRRRR
jgi:hypothetical protein